MNLVFDIGNTFTKVAVFESGKIVFNTRLRVVKPVFIDKLLKKFTITKAVISTVKPVKHSWQNLLAEKIPLNYFSFRMASTVTNHYLTPETLGTDRLAGVMGGKAFIPAPK